MACQRKGSRQTPASHETPILGQRCPTRSSHPGFRLSYAGTPNSVGRNGLEPMYQLLVFLGRLHCRGALDRWLTPCWNIHGNIIVNIELQRTTCFLNEMSQGPCLQLQKAFSVNPVGCATHGPRLLLLKGNDLRLRDCLRPNQFASLLLLDNNNLSPIPGYTKQWSKG